MAYSDFTTIAKVQALGIKVIEAQFLPDITPISPSDYLKEALRLGLPLVLARGSEKARSELLIAPILLEVSRHLSQQASLFSGEDFTVDPARGLNGLCDFLISNSPQQLEIEKPVIVIVEAKKVDLNSGLAQCLAEMVAAQQFNQSETELIYGCVTTGTGWKFLKLQGAIASVDVFEYSIPPVDYVLGVLVWMVRQFAAA
ncbi:hypothetical protein [Alkalinema sp. FACHB-956]|uniref:hypothetical protein n=1 Tax=Alkalinema sp. FACHB-956 TaxID=2692768 RepID=UPI0016822F94|nr:hypothetical protein [Alkalinema sp. FACHB-956]MBD2325791.1 hypothetical protein [Alkalinema sp. FACHB-956]